MDIRQVFLEKITNRIRFCHFYRSFETNIETFMLLDILHYCNLLSIKAIFMIIARIDLFYFEIKNKKRKKFEKKELLFLGHMEEYT